MDITKEAENLIRQAQASGKGTQQSGVLDAEALALTSELDALKYKIESLKTRFELQGQSRKAEFLSGVREDLTNNVGQMSCFFFEEDSDGGTATAEQLYKAYGDSADWKNHLGKPMPPFTELPNAIKSHWVAVEKIANF